MHGRFAPFQPRALCLAFSALLLLFPAHALLAQDSSQDPNQNPAQDTSQPLNQEQPSSQEPVPPQSGDSNQSSNQPGASPTHLSVRGTVTNAATGEPLPRALLQIEGDNETGALTDGEGRFELDSVPDGPQILRVVKPGFRDRPYAAEDAGLQSEGPAHSILVAAQMPELAFALAPNCAIHGRIELSTGDPADDISLLLFKRVIRNGRGIWAQVAGARTNGDGAYRFGGLPDGVYAVSTLPALESEPAISAVADNSATHVARNGFASIFYPDARDFAGAARIQLSNGSQTEANFSLSLEPFYSITAFTGSAASNTAAKAVHLGNLSASIMDAAGHPLFYTAQYDDATHSIQADLPDGSYTFEVGGMQNQPGRSGVSSFVTDGPPAADTLTGALTGSIAFTVAGHAIAGLRIPMSPPQSLSIHLRVNRTSLSTASSLGGNASDLVSLSLDRADGIPFNDEVNGAIQSHLDEIDTAARPGSWWLSAAVQRKGLCAGSLTGGGVNLAHDPLAINQATAPPPMELTLRDDCATLSLALPPSQSTFLPGEEPFFYVYLVPDFDTVQDIPPMTVHPSSGPTLTVDSLTPGSYHIYTFDTPVHLEYRAPGALPAAGQQVTLAAGTVSNLVLEAPQH